jgi:hypothetical protein
MYHSYLYYARSYNAIRKVSSQDSQDGDIRV